MGEEIKVIFENSELLVLDKPAGWVTTNENSKPKNQNTKSIESWLRGK